MNSQELKKFGLPNKPGVYFFKKGKHILYIGKATSLSDRVKSYFSKDLIATRGPLILDMVVQADKIHFEVADSVLEALILESNLIKKHQPKYNTKEKDNKSWNYVCITRDEVPQVLIIRGRSIKDSDGKLSIDLNKKYQAVYGPFPNGLQLKEAMKIIRRIFPYMDAQSSKKNNFLFYEQLGLVPKIEYVSQKASFKKVLARPNDIVGQGSPSPSSRPDHFENNFSAPLKEYKQNIMNLKLFFQGKKKKIILNFKKEMMQYAKQHQFEKANEIKKRIFALDHINDVALIKEDLFDISQRNADAHISISHSFRIEAYDIAHLSGKNMVGVMTIVEDGEAQKQEYKKFIIRTQEGANDTGALEEVLSRRFRHMEWGLPRLIVVDGSTAQINVAHRVLDRYMLKIPVVGVVKDDKHKAKAIMGDEKIINIHKKSILLANSESHRFAINYYRQKSRKNMLK